MDNLTDLLDEPKVFIKDSIHLLNRCTKPDRRGSLTLLNIEFIEIARAVATGFVLMGFIGFFVKLIHIPINNIIVYVFSVLNLVDNDLF